MQKGILENTIKSLPSLISNIVGYFKTNLSLEKQKDTLTNAGGTIGFLINLFGEHLLDKYFENRGANKLKDFGFQTYAKASFRQAVESLQILEVDPGMPTLDIPALLVEKNFFDSITKYDKSLSILVFQPKFHPAVLTVKNSIIEMLGALNIESNQIKIFQKHFNDNIEKTVEDIFGDDYESHKKIVKKFWFQENETQLLIDIIEQNKIGFVENENLKYEPAFGTWAPISQRGYGDENNVDIISALENKLSKIETLIDEYFKVDATNHLEKILFIIADFGKGKSVFLKQYASELAKNYMETGEGHFPIYFNLRNFSSYNSDTQLGIIEDYLQTKYAIKINSDYFKSKQYFFLIDSLDESCDLSRSAVEKVVSSIKRIQNIDKTIYRTNKILITSRPFDESLFSIISNNKPFLIKEEGKDIPHYISLYGFKMEQFNDWIYSSLHKIVNNINIAGADEFIKKILLSIKEDKKIDIYTSLINNQTLTSSELRRPIFAYMVYRLIQNNINVTSVGKIGIYLSFLNLLSKEAKYIHDPSFKIKIQEQFEARNILHQIAALWTYERQQGRQGLLKKADVCRVVGGYGNDLSDDEVIELHKKKGGNDIQFLSHSYFGENDNILHFQHQSFAEILLAEYYIKVFIKCALDRTFNIDFVVSKLKIGIPTPQTIEFFREILKLLKDCSTNDNSNETLEKRNLLIPLLASISIVNNNQTLYSDQLFYQWYEKGKIDKHTTEIPKILCESWCINQDVLNRIIDLCEQVILSEKIFILSKSNNLTALIEKEITHISNLNYLSTLNLDKELALIAGNAIYNQSGNFFIRKFNSEISLFLFHNLKSEWIINEFRGVIIDLLPSRPIKLTFYRYDLSNCIFRNCWFYNSYFIQCNLENAVFENVYFGNSRVDEIDFSKATLSGIVDMTDVFFSDEIKIPSALKDIILNRIGKMKANKSENYWMLRYRKGFKFSNYNLVLRNERNTNYIFESLEFYLKYCIMNNLLTHRDILRVFKTKSKSLKELVHKKISQL